VLTSRTNELNDGAIGFVEDFAPTRRTIRAAMWDQLLIRSSIVAREWRPPGARRRLPVSHPRRVSHKIVPNITLL